MNAFRNVYYLIFAAMILASAACGDDTAAPNYMDRSDNNVRMPGDNNKEPDPTPVEDRVLEAVSPVTATAEKYTLVRLEAALVLEDSRTPVVGELVDFTVLQAPDSTLELSADSIETDEDGVAGIDVTVGATAGQIIIRASHPGTTPVEFRIEVTDQAPGAIEVEIFPPAGVTVNLAPYRVRAYDTEQFGDCQAIPPRADLAGATAEATSQGQLVLMENVPAEKTYTVLVQALGTSASAIAYGCVDAVTVETRETTSISVSLRMIPLNPTGTYKVTGFWDISEAVRTSGDAGNIIVGLIDFMSNPGMFLYDLIIDELQQASGLDLTFLAALGVPTIVSDAINGWLFQNSDLARFNEIAVGQQTMLYNLEVESELVIEKTEADLTFIGYEHWQKIILNLSWQCDVNSPPDCGRYEIPVDPDGNLPALGYVSYDWTGEVVDYDGLKLDSLQTQIEYGKLLVLIIEKVVMPELTGGNADTLAGALNYWVDCPGLAQDLVGSGIGATIVDTACQAALTTAAGVIVAPLQNENVVFDLVFDGEATMKDTASNGWVDEIRDGENVGTMVNSGAPVTVEWSATLVEP